MSRLGVTIRMTEALATELRAHLFPGDDLEAVALMLCRPVRSGRRTKYLGYALIRVPHEACHRQRDAISWPGAFVEQALERAETEGLAIIAVHSHPSGFLGFSAADDASDADLMPAMSWFNGCAPGSAIMTPEGRMAARIYERAKPCSATIIVAGHDISVHDADASPAVLPFTAAMTETLSRLSACVIGVSGTGSIVAEQLARLGFGELILIDFDRLERRNLNRILNSGATDLGALKVDMLAAALGKHLPDCDVRSVPHALAERDALIAASDADVLFSCVDTDEGRQLADRLAACFLIPLIDMGVSIPTRTDSKGTPQIIDVCGRIDYVFPGGATLADRAVYTPASLEAEYLRKHAPQAHTARVAEGYLRGVPEEAPAVIALNMRAASAAVMEFIARAFPFRHQSNEKFARSLFLLAEGCEEHTAETEFTRAEGALLGRGDQEPWLGLPALTPPTRGAAR